MKQFYFNSIQFNSLYSAKICKSIVYNKQQDLIQWYLFIINPWYYRNTALLLIFLNWQKHSYSISWVYYFCLHLNNNNIVNLNLCNNMSFCSSYLKTNVILCVSVYGMISVRISTMALCVVFYKICYSIDDNSINCLWKEDKCIHTADQQMLNFHWPLNNVTDNDTNNFSPSACTQGDI